MSDELDLAPVSLPAAGVTPSPPPEGFAWRVSEFENAIVAADKAYQYDSDIYARRNALSDAIDRRNWDIQRATGDTLENPWNGGYEAEARDKLYKSGQPGAIWETREQIWRERLGLLQTQYPEHADKIGADRPVLEDAKQIADYWTDRAARGQPGLNAAAGLAASFLGGLRGFLRNPLNLALLPIGGGEVKAASVAGKIAEGFLREAAVNAGQQALGEPAVQAWRAERGRESGVLPALEDIGVAALFGGTVGASFQGAKVAAGAALAKRASAGERAALTELPATGVAEHAPAVRSLSEALDADEAAFAGAPEGVKGLDATVAQALDNVEGMSDALPELPPVDGAADALARLSALDPGPVHDPFEAAAVLRGAPDLAKAARGHDAPDIAVAGRLAQLGDAAFDAARNGEVSQEVALAAATRVADAGEQLSVMRAAQAERPRTLEEAGEAVSREMQARALPAAQARILENAPASRVPDAPGFDRVGQRLTEHTAQLERELIAKAPADDAPIAVKPKRTVTRQFPTLFETLASEGGLAPHPELKEIFNGNPFVPGFGRLVREGGRTLDDAVQAAKDLGYMFDAADHGAGELKLAVNDLLDLLRREAHGDKVHSFSDLQEMAARDAARAGKDYEKARRAAVKTLKAQPELQPDKARGWTPNENILDRAAALMAEDDELSPLQAWDVAAVDYERDLMARSEQFPELQEARLAETGEIPGWDVPARDTENALDAKAARQDGGDGAQAREEKAGAGGGAGSAGEGTREHGQGPQSDVRAPTEDIAIERADGSVEFVSREKLLAPDNGEEIAGLIEQCRD